LGQVIKNKRATKKAMSMIKPGERYEMSHILPTHFLLGHMFLKTTYYWQK
jgi:hypothetical protein